MKAVLVALTLPFASIAAAAPIEIHGPPGGEAAASTPPSTPPSTPVAFAPRGALDVPAQSTPAKPVGVAARQQAVASDHGLVGGTAITIPEGHVEVSLQMVAPYAGIATLGAGITKSTELWVDGATTLSTSDGGEAQHTYAVGLKQVLIRSRNGSIAATGALRKISSGFGESSGWKALGLVGSACLDDGCGVLVSGSVQRLFGYYSYDYDTGGSSNAQTLITVGASVGGSTTRFLLDLVQLNEDAVGFLGIRLGTTAAAFDLGFGKSLGGGSEEAVPWLGVTGRM